MIIADADLGIDERLPGRAITLFYDSSLDC